MIIVITLWVNPLVTPKIIQCIIYSNPTTLYPPTERSQYGKDTAACIHSLSSNERGVQALEKALAPRDQRALEELFVNANKHIAETQFASSPFLEDIFILAMLLEMHKKVMEMEGRVMSGEAK